MTAGGRIRAAVISVGNELLYGETVDTNAAWLGRFLSSLGISVVTRFTVPDVEEAIQQALREAMSQADLVLMTGGLGPTRDDVTRDAVAAALGRALVVQDDILAELRSRFEKRGFGRLPEPNTRQAEVPTGAVVLVNPHGTAPGLALHEGESTVVLLPGVPREMRGIVEGDFQRVLIDRLGDRLAPVHHRSIHTTGVPESRLAEMMTEAGLDEDGALGEAVQLAFLPDLRGVDLRLSVQNRDPELAEEALDRAEGLLAPVVAPWRFRAPTGDLAEAVLAALRETGETLSVAESCTAGMIAARLTDHTGASDVFMGGVVAYANEVKRALLAVEETSLAQHGAVSEPVARAMASGVIAATGATMGLAVTGIAGPGGGTAEKPVGTVWIAASRAGSTVSEKAVFAGDRAAVRERAAQAALALALRQLGGLGEKH